jgi:kinase suppressor of Ras 2
MAHFVKYSSFALVSGLKCKECKFKCHRDCESKVPPSCCLPDDFFKLFAHQLTSQSQSPILPSRMREQNSAGIHSLGGGTSAAAAAAAEHQRMISSVGPTMGGGHGGGGGGGVGPGGVPYPDSSSNTSSCNSSTPSSPGACAFKSGLFCIES